MTTVKCLVALFITASDTTSSFRIIVFQLFGSLWEQTDGAPAGFDPLFENSNQELYLTLVIDGVQKEVINDQEDPVL